MNCGPKRCARTASSPSDGGGGTEGYGVIDELCRRAFLAGDTVLAVRAADVPGGGPAAAILRYPV